MKKYLFFVITILLCSCSKNEKTSFPLDYEQEKLIDKLINNMTLEEKVGQTCQITLDAILLKDSLNKLIVPHQIDSVKLNEALLKYKVGSILNVSNHTFTLDKWHKILSQIHEKNKQNPHGIQVIYGIDAIHGATYLSNSTLFPQQIGLAATWDTSHARKLGEVTAYETRASGIRWNFSPVLDLGRTPIWSRFFETFGEDVYLAKTMGKSIVNGYQGEQFNDYTVAACLKHYVGYSFPRSGRDRTPALIPKRIMQEYYLPPFEEAIKSGALTVMINSGEVNGIPGHTNKYLISEVLKEKWNFAGFTLSDWEDYIKLHKEHLTDSTIEMAIASAFNAGVDMSMVPNNPQYKVYCKSLIKLLNDGVVSEERLNDAVRRILRVKGKIGLLSDLSAPDKNNYPDLSSKKHRDIAYNAAKESITLLKNQNNILPLKSEDKILLIGPTSNSLNCLNGAWTHTWQGIETKYNNDFPTIKQELESRLKNVFSFEGSKMLMKDGDEFDEISNDLKEAVRVSKSVDVAIVCVGELPSTEMPGDIYSLNLPDEQKMIVKELHKSEIPIVLVLVSGRPKIIRDIEPLCDGILQAYLPGDQGGVAVVDVLTGVVNPSGKLPYTYPRYDGAILYYDHKKLETLNGNNWKYDFFHPQWNFGYGLSYTDFKFSNLRLSKKNISISKNEKITLSVDVENTGDIFGKEVVQLYARDHYASISPPLRKLVRYNKISLEPKQKKTVIFELEALDFGFFGIDFNWTNEVGKHSFFVGDLEASFNLIK